MQLFAFNKKNQLVSASHALRQQDYTCAECGGVVRLRGGAHRQRHFYHLKPDWSCRQSQKSLVHLQVQQYLLQILPPGECALEVRFPEIQRIADVFWEPRKLVFEVQCSGITAEEVASRNGDYSRLGYQVVWILHEKRFNKWRLTACEEFLRESPHYFTNMDAEGRGFIYDQVDVIQKGQRKTLAGFFRVHLDQPVVLPEKEPTKKLPSILNRRWKHWPLFFAGDLSDRWIQGDPKVLEPLGQVCDVEEMDETFASKAKNLIHWCFVRPYLLVFRMLLESACK